MELEKESIKKCGATGEQADLFPSSKRGRRLLLRPCLLEISLAALLYCAVKPSKTADAEK